MSPESCRSAPLEPIPIRKDKRAGKAGPLTLQPVVVPETNLSASDAAAQSMRLDEGAMWTSWSRAYTPSAPRRTMWSRSFRRSAPRAACRQIGGPVMASSMGLGALSGAVERIAI
jgi:hypothetical protein